MRLFLLFLAFPFLSPCKSQIQPTENLILTYDKPADIWEETLPLGNGRLGMMPDGKIEKEEIILNDISMWSGSTQDALNKEALRFLPVIRNLLLKGKNLEAQELMHQHFRCKGKGSNLGEGLNAPYGCFQLLGKLNIQYQYPDTTAAQDYRFELDISTAKATTRFRKNKVRFRREYFVSHANDVMLIRISASERKTIHLNVSLSRAERSQIFSKNGDLCMQGQLNDGYKGKKGVRFSTQLRILNKGGAQKHRGKSIAVQNADEVLIILSSATNLLCSNLQKTVDSLLNQAGRLSFKELEHAHTAAYQKKFNRVSLHLGEGADSVSSLTTTPQRLYNFQTQYDPSLAALYFQYGRYLMISGTREGSMPLNLQGLWANSLQTPWNGDYHLNINVQMNYWPAEVCNLSELHKPLLAFTKSLVSSGMQTAKVFYGAKGWVAHVISNPWQFTAPGEHASWGATNTGGAWLCAHLWQHYEFTQDKRYLATVFPTMKKAAQFFLSTLIKEPQHGWLVTAPSSSPENSFYLPNSTKPTYVCMGPTMDTQIVRELFQNTIKAAEILTEHDAVLEEIRQKLLLLPPTQISPQGYIQEWLEDYKEVDVEHRHVSHLYGLFPAAQISPEKTPKLAEAAKITLNRRGDEGTGWSRAWKINFWARLYDGHRAYKLLKKLLKPTVSTSYDYLKAGGTYPNLFCAHPPFQIDGNFGGTAGIAEMLLQSHEGYIHILPAIPRHWKEGHFKGLLARGGATVAASWKNGKVRSISLQATVNNSFRVKMPNSVEPLFSPNSKVSINKGFFTAKLKKGESLTLYFKG